MGAYCCQDIGPGFRDRKHGTLPWSYAAIPLYNHWTGEKSGANVIMARKVINDWQGPISSDVKHKIPIASG